MEFLVIGQCPPTMDKSQKHNLVRKAESYQLIEGELYRLGPDDVLRQCFHP